LESKRARLTKSFYYAMKFIDRQNVEYQELHYQGQVSDPLGLAPTTGIITDATEE
jgi:hypothetical protein